jgi:hypothetical protein
MVAARRTTMRGATAQRCGITRKRATTPPSRCATATPAPFRARIATFSNLMVAVVTVNGGAGESLLKEMHSFDYGATWSALTSLVDATSGGHPTWTLGSVEMTTNTADGAVALAYSLVNGTTHQGAYLKEFF